MKTYQQFITEAKKRIHMVKVHHGTSASNAEKINKSGFGGDEVHASTSSGIAKSFGQRKGEDTRIIRMNVPKKDVKSDAPAKVLKTQGQRGTDNYGREHYSVIMSPDYASKKISKGTPVIPAPRLGKEFKKYQDRMPKAFQKRTKTTPKKTLREFLEESARRRLSFTRFHHGSDSDSIKSIQKSGPKSSREGSQGPGHYVTPDQSKARKYAEFTSKQRGKKPAVVSYRVSSDKITKVDDIPKKLSTEPQVSSKKPVVHNTRTGHAVVDSDYAKGKIIKSNSTVGTKGKGKRTKTQPKKDS